MAEARGETRDVELAEVNINLPADFFLAEEYLPEVDRRVLVYRKLAAAVDIAEVDALQEETEERFGALPLAGKNLFDRARVRIRAQRLGCTTISLTNGRVIYQGVDVPRAVALKLKGEGALNYPKTHKLAYPFRRKDSELMPVALGVLEQIGGDDEVDE